jgi:hypothetical protein
MSDSAAVLVVALSQAIERLGAKPLARVVVYATSGVAMERHRFTGLRSLAPRTRRFRLSEATRILANESANPPRAYAVRVRREGARSAAGKSN